MDISQETIVEYLKRDSLSLTKSSSNLDRQMFLYLTDKRLMIKHNEGYASISMEGRSFINNSYYFNPIPETVFDWKKNIIDQLQNGERQLDGDGDDFQAAKTELKQDGIIEKGSYGYYHILTSKGRLLLNSGLSYNDFLSSFMSSTNTTVYNLNGINSRFYNQSQDYSNNNVNKGNKEVFKLLKQIIEDKITDNSLLLDLLRSMENPKTGEDFLQKYTQFIKAAANHMNLLAHLIPELTAFISTH